MTGGAVLDHPTHDIRIVRDLGPWPIDDRDGASVVDGPNRQVFRFTSEEQNSIRTGRVSHRPQNDIGQSVRSSSGGHRVKQLMCPDRIDPGRTSQVTAK